jgi:hypothetical protein
MPLDLGDPMDSHQRAAGPLWITVIRLPVLSSHPSKRCQLIGEG